MWCPTNSKWVKGPYIYCIIHFSNYIKFVFLQCLIWMGVLFSVGLFLFALQIYNDHVGWGIIILWWQVSIFEGKWSLWDRISKRNHCMWTALDTAKSIYIIPSLTRKACTCAPSYLGGPLSSAGRRSLTKSSTFFQPGDRVFSTGSDSVAENIWKWASAYRRWRIRRLCCWE